MTQHVTRLVDIEATVCIAVDGDMTMEQARQWIEDAITAKLCAEAELEDWGGGTRRVYPNGPACTAAWIDGADR